MNLSPFSPRFLLHPPPPPQLDILLQIQCAKVFSTCSINSICHRPISFDLCGVRDVCFRFSADENQKLSKISILSQKVDFVDTSEKLCSVSIDEYFTTINCHRPIELANLASARILTKVDFTSIISPCFRVIQMRQNQKYPIGFCFTTTTSDEQFEFLLPEHSTRSDMIWLKVC